MGGIEDHIIREEVGQDGIARARSDLDACRILAWVDLDEAAGAKGEISLGGSRADAQDALLVILLDVLHFRLGGPRPDARAVLVGTAFHHFGLADGRALGCAGRQQRKLHPPAAPLGLKVNRHAGLTRCCNQAKRSVL